MTHRCGLFLILLAALSRTGNGAEIVVESVLISVIHSAEVPARDAGVLTEMLVKEGTLVEQGDLLVKLDAEEAELQLHQTELQLDIAQKEFKNGLRSLYALKAAEVAQAEVERAEEANKKYSETVSRTEVARLKLISQKAGIDWQLSEHEHEILGVTAEMKKNEVLQAKHLLERRLIRSPLAGTVVRIDQRLGEWVQPGMTILKIIDTHTLRAEAVLPGKYRHTKLVDCAVRVPVPGATGDTPLLVEGRISFVQPEIDPVDGSFRVWADLKNEAQLLRPGDSVRMQIVLPDEEER